MSWLLIVSNIALAVVNVSAVGIWHGLTAIFCAVIAGMLLSQELG